MKKNTFKGFKYARWNDEDNIWEISTSHHTRRNTQDEWFENTSSPDVDSELQWWKRGSCSIHSYWRGRTDDTLYDPDLQGTKSSLGTSKGSTNRQGHGGKEDIEIWNTFDQPSNPPLPRVENLLERERSPSKKWTLPQQRKQACWTIYRSWPTAHAKTHMKWIKDKS